MRFLNLFLRGTFILKNETNYCRITSRKCCGNRQEPCNTTQIKSVNEQFYDKKEGLVLGVYVENNKLELTEAAKEIDEKSGGKISKHLNTLSSQLSLGKAFVVTDIVPEYETVALTSLGPKSPGYNQLEELDETRENIRWGIGAGVHALVSRGCTAVHCDPADEPDAAAEAATLAAWRFQEFKSQPDPSPMVTYYGSPEVEEAWKDGAIRAEAQNWARYLSDMPANKMTPVDLAQAAFDTLCPLGVKVEVQEQEWIAAQNMEGFLAVARGSCEEPLLLECVYRGGPAELPPVLLAAKGVTFDSGGLCLKRPTSMVENRGSMAGAAVVLATLKALAELKVPINVSCVIPLCENMVSGRCMKVGDVVRAPNGLSILIEDTDMEGRLMLADALVYGQSIHRPSLVIDVATLTPRVQLATAGGSFACFSNSEPAWAAARRAGGHTGDRPWRFPLWDYYLRQITDNPAVDLRNQGSGKATPCIGAAFLRRFVCGPWLHADITGVALLQTASASPQPYLAPHRMSGRPTRTLTTLLGHLANAN